MTAAPRKKSTTKPSSTAAKEAPVLAAARPMARLTRILPWLLVICGVIGVIASVMITVEKFDLIKNPHYQPICNLNPVISCGSVMASKQANAFGFMNTYIGLLGFPVVVTIGMAMLAGAKFKRWFWLGLQVGLSLGIIFAYWLLFESMYRIRALCPYCLSVDVALTTAWWYTTLWNFYDGNLQLPKRARALGGFVKRHHVDILVFWFLLVIAAILQHFWYYFGQHI
jgi:uncharacterized membrane protein